MAINVYKSVTGDVTFPVTFKTGKRQFIQFGGPKSEFSTGSLAIQKAIERHKRFKAGEIILASGVKEPAGEDIQDKAGEEVTEVLEVTTIQAARDYLKAEPYKVVPQALNTPNAILKKAAELGVSFPNLNKA